MLLPWLLGSRATFQFALLLHRVFRLTPDLWSSSSWELGRRNLGQSTLSLDRESAKYDRIGTSPSMRSHSARP